MTPREDALALVAQLRAGGVRFSWELGTLRLTYRDPAGVVTPETLERWRPISLDVRAVLLAEVADAAHMAERAGLPGDVTMTNRPGGAGRRGASPAALPPRADRGADKIAAVALRLRADAEAAAAAERPPLPFWRCPCGASSVRPACWNCGNARPPGAPMVTPPWADDFERNRTDTAGQLAGTA